MSVRVTPRLWLESLDGQRDHRSAQHEDDVFAEEDDGFICGFMCWEAPGDTCKASDSGGIAAAWGSGIQDRG